MIDSSWVEFYRDKLGFDALHHDGGFAVLEDNLRTPSGISYVIENRRAMTHVFPELADMVVHENAVRHALARLGGTRLAFSNAPRRISGCAASATAPSNGSGAR